jgi:cell filamentation protein
MRRSSFKICISSVSAHKSAIPSHPNIRTIRIGKQGNWFCYPEYIDDKMRQLFTKLADDNYLRDLDPAQFAEKAAACLTELNAIHPFREGNGRTQTIFLSILCDQAGHPLDLERLRPHAMMQAVIASFAGDEKPLGGIILELMRAR